MFLLFLLPITLCGGVINVPGDYISISAAVNASSDGEIIAISQGIFSGIENCGIFINKPLMLKGAGPAGTIIDCGGTGMRCLEIENVEGEVMIDGIQFSNGITPQLFLPKITTTQQEESMLRSESFAPLHDNIPGISKGGALTTTTTSADWTPIATLLLTPQGLVLVPNIIRGRKKKKCCEREKKEQYVPIAGKTANATSTQEAELAGASLKRKPIVSAAEGITARTLVDAMDAGGCVVAVNVDRISLSNVWINGGQAGRRGGGMAIIGSSSVVINRCDISNNRIFADIPTVKSKGGAQGGGLMITDTMDTSILSTSFFRNTISVSGTSTSFDDTAMGGGMYWTATSSFASVLVNGTFATNNSISSFGADDGNLLGGGMYCRGTALNNTIMISETNILFNSVSGSGSQLGINGGGMYTSCHMNSATSFVRSSINSNSISGSGVASVLQGGGLCMESNINSALTVLSSSITANTISGSGLQSFARGGGLLMSSKNKNNTCIVSSSSIASNTILGVGFVSNMLGGGLYLNSNNNDVLSVLSSSIVSNIISGPGRFLYGGGVYMYGGTKGNVLTVSSSSIISNTISGSESKLVLYGGGLFMESARDNAMSVVSSSIISNTVITESALSMKGGGLYMYGNSGDVLSVLSSSIISNTLSGLGLFLYGGGLYVWSESTNHAVTLFSLLITSNTISGSGSGSLLYGGGLYVSSENTNHALTLSSSMIISNTISGSGSGSLLKGGGLISLIGKSNCTFTLSSLWIILNSISGSGSGSFLYGGGICMYGGTKGNVLTVSSSSITSNTISGSGSSLHGGGMHIFTHSETNLVLLASIYVANNLLRGDTAFIFPGVQFLDVLRPVSNISVPCSGALLVTSMSGIIADGSGSEYYGDNQQCSWKPRISDRTFYRSNAAFAFRFRALSLEANGVSACFDYVAIYDGPTSLSPLIGKYCGTMSDSVCAAGSCPPINGTLLTTQSDFYMYFSTDGSTSRRGGFEIAYAAVELPSSKTVAASTVALLRSMNLFDSSNSSIGGGLCIEGPLSAIINNCHFHNNSVQHWLSAAGGGIAVLNALGAEVTLSSVLLDGNSALSDGYAASGGGIASIAANIKCTKNVTLLRNAVFATGSCWNQLDVAGWSCPTSLGGAIVAMVGGTLMISSIDSTLVANKAGCSISAIAERAGQPCLSGGGGVASIGESSQIIISSGASLVNNVAPRGGAIYVTDSAVVKLQQNASCTNNTADCTLTKNAIGCQMSAGGCGYVDSGELHFAGGVLIAKNRANEGGAVFATDDGKSISSNSSFASNYADVIGGALMSYSRASILVDGGSFQLNNASRATVLAGMNEDGSSLYSFTGNISIVAANGSLAIAAGHWVGLDRQTKWECAHEGSYFRIDASSQGFFSMQCDVCSSGSYAVGKAKGVRECLPCPYGGACGQSNATWNGLRAVGGFSGREVGTGVQFLPCPPGYCCPVGRNCTFDYCGGGREGLLCSRCPNGTGLAYFTTGCVPSETCNDLKWVLPVAFVAAIMMAFWLLKTTGRDSSGLIAVLLFFYQISPVVKSTPWQHIAPEIIGAVQAIFQVSAPDVSGDDGSNYESSSPSRAGVCIVPEMKASQKLGSRLLFQALVFLAILVVAIVHLSLHHLLPRRIKRPASWKALYLPTLIRFLTIAYLTLVLVPLQMIQCVRIDGEQKWWWDAQVNCFEAWQVGAIVAISVLSPIPLLMIWVSKQRILTRFHRVSARLSSSTSTGASMRTQHTKFKWLMSTDTVLCNGFRDERRWWLGVSLYRRLIVVVIYTAIEDSNWRSIAMTCALCVFLMINLVMKPFKNIVTHRAETGSLLILCFLSALTSPQLSQSQFGTSETVYDEKGLEIVQMTLLAIPIVVYVILQLWQLFGERFLRRKTADRQCKDDERDMQSAPVLATDVMDHVETSSSMIEQSPSKQSQRGAHCAICEAMEKDSANNNNNDDDLMAVMLDGLSEEEQEEVLRCDLHEFC